jgi:hypothetical protein
MEIRSAFCGRTRQIRHHDPLAGTSRDVHTLLT